MAYLNSSNINIYPLAKQRTASEQKWNRLTSEFNMANIIRQLLPKNSQGFVIDWDGQKVIKFNIGGYYVEADLSEALSGTEIYANLSITPDANNNLPEVSGQDDKDTGKYTGISFDSSANSNAAYSLNILTKIKDSSTWDIPEESKFPFSSDSLYITEINGNI